MIIPILKWLARVPVDLLTTVLGRVLAPFVVLFQRDERLPWWLSYWMTYDNTLAGDYGWQTEHWQFRHKLPGWLGSYVGRVGWLLRNNMYGFAIDVLGCKAQPGYSMTISGDIRVSNRPLVEGLVIRTITNPDGKMYFQLYYVKVRNEKYCWRINLGWKLWNLQEGEKRQMVVSINPWMGYMRALA